MTSGAWGAQIIMLEVDSDSFQGARRHLNPVVGRWSFFFGVPLKNPGYPDIIREVAHMLTSAWMRYYGPLDCYRVITERCYLGWQGA